MRIFILSLLFPLLIFNAFGQSIVAQNDFICKMDLMEYGKYPIDKVTVLDDSSIITLNLYGKKFILTKWNDNLTKIWETPIVTEKNESVSGIYSIGKSIIVSTYIYNEKYLLFPNANEEYIITTRAYLYSSDDKDKKPELLSSSKSGIQIFNKTINWVQPSEDKSYYIWSSMNPLNRQITETPLEIDPKKYDIGVRYDNKKLFFNSIEKLSNNTPSNETDIDLGKNLKFKNHIFLYDVLTKELKELNVSIKSIDWMYFIDNEHVYIIQKNLIDDKELTLNFTKLNVNTNKIIYSKDYVLPKIQSLNQTNQSIIFTKLPNGNLLYTLEYSNMELLSSYAMHSGNLNFFIINPDGEVLSDKIIERSYKTKDINGYFTLGSSVFVNDSLITFFLYSGGGMQKTKMVQATFEGNIFKNGLLFSDANKPKESNYFYNSYTTKLNDNNYLFVGLPSAFQTKVKIYKVATH